MGRRPCQNVTKKHPACPVSSYTLRPHLVSQGGCQLASPVYRRTRRKLGRGNQTPLGRIPAWRRVGQLPARARQLTPQATEEGRTEWHLVCSVDGPGDNPVTRHPRSRWVALVAYASAFVALAVGLVVFLPAGTRIHPAPQAPSVGEVTAGSECLGERVAFVQSGVFLDLHIPGSQGFIDRDLGAVIATGRIDRLSGEVSLVGTCASTARLVGQSVTIQAVVVEDQGLSGTAALFGARRIPVEIVAADVSELGPSAEALSGGALLSRLLLAVAVVILTARGLGSVFSKIGQPRVIGEIAAGIVLGPSLLGLLFPEVTNFLFPSSVTDVMAILAQFGLILFMFLIGLELDHAMIRGSGRTAVMISHYSIVVPLVLGLGAAVLIYPLLGSGDFVGFALFLGAAMAITAFPVLARILTDTGLHRTRLGALAITCAAVDDVTAWCVLAIVVAIVKATGPTEAATTIVLSVVFVVGMLVVVRPLIGSFMASRRNNGAINATAMALLIAGLFLAAWATEAIGIHAIFGAFMFGAILPRQRGMASKVTERLEDVTVLFLLPVFFAVVGLSTQIGLVSGIELWLVTALIIGIAIAGKVGGSLIAGLASGETVRASLVIGVLMNARGITEIVILTIGRELGVISPALFTIMVIMALVTTFMTTPLVTRLYPRDQVERDIASSQRVHKYSIDRSAKRVMIGVTDPETARPLIQVAGWLREEDLPMTVVLAAVVSPPGREQVRANLGGIAQATAVAAGHLGIVAEDLDRQGMTPEIVTRAGTDRAEELRQISTQQAVDLTVIGSHQAFLRHRPLAGLVDELLRTSPTDIAVVVNGIGLMSTEPGPVGVWLGGRTSDRPTLDLARKLSAGMGRPIRVAGPAVGSLKLQDADTVPCHDIASARAVLSLAAVVVIAYEEDRSSLDAEVLEMVTSPGERPAIVFSTGGQSA